MMHCKCLTGACAFAGSILTLLPVSILYGVFVYLALVNLLNVQFIERLVLFALPQKYFPNKAYCQQVYRAHAC